MLIGYLKVGVTALEEFPMNDAKKIRTQATVEPVS